MAPRCAAPSFPPDRELTDNAERPRGGRRKKVGHSADPPQDELARQDWRLLLRRELGESPQDPCLDNEMKAETPAQRHVLLDSPAQDSHGRSPSPSATALRSTAVPPRPPWRRWSWCRRSCGGERHRFREATLPDESSWWRGCVGTRAIRPTWPASARRCGPARVSGRN